MSSKESVISGAEKPSWSFALGRRHPPKNNGPTPCKQHEQARIEVCDEWDRWIKVKRNRVTRGPTDQLPGETDEYVFKLMHAGDGASGKVSLVMNARTGRMMARKVIKLDDSVQNRAIAKRESDNLECLEKLGDRSHDLNIVRFYHFFPIESAFHIYMTPAHGSLRDSLLEQHEENDVMSITGVQDLARQMLNALIYLHEVEGIIHRDIKPDNILVLHPSDNSRPITYLLADFGLTTRAEYIARTKCGTSKYVAPEIASLDELHRLRKLEDGRGQTGAVDIWSLGVTLLETRLRGDLCGPRSWENWDLKLWCQFLEWQTRSSPLTPLLTYDVKKRASARLLYKTLKLDRAQFESMNANCDLETFERYIAQSTGLPYDENKALQRKRKYTGIGRPHTAHIAEHRLEHQDNLKSMSCDSYHGSTPSSGSKKRGLDGFVQDFQMKKR